MRALRSLEDLEPLFKFRIHLSVRKSRENYRQIYGKCKASLWRNLSTDTPPKFFLDNLLHCSFSLQLIFFSEQPFYGNYPTLDSHTNTVISHAFAYSSRWRRKPWQGLFISLFKGRQGRKFEKISFISQEMKVCFSVGKHFFLFTLS